MNLPFIPVNVPLLDGNEKQYVGECVDSGWISSEGSFVSRFEQELAAKVGRSYGVAVCNGSVALDLAVFAMGIGKGDEVILPSFTIISCAAAIVRVGAVPVLIDSDALTWNMRVDQVEEKITERTKAIFIVHIYGLPVDVNPLLDLARKYGLKIIEDAAEAHGQTYRGSPCGSFGSVSTFSFYSNKLVATGEGGMLLTDDPEIADRCRSYRNLCFQKQRFIHKTLGWNYRMSNLQAALGVAQLERLEHHLARKRAIGALYEMLLRELPCLIRPLIKTAYAENAYWVFGIILTDKLPFDAGEAMRRLAARNIGTRPFFWPMHEQPVFREMGLFNGVNLPVAERIARRGFYLPSGLGLRDDEVVRVAETCFDIFGKL